MLADGSLIRSKHDVFEIRSLGNNISLLTDNKELPVWGFAQKALTGFKLLEIGKNVYDKQLLWVFNDVYHDRYVDGIQFY